MYYLLFSLAALFRLTVGLLVLLRVDFLAHFLASTRVDYLLFLHTVFPLSVLLNIGFLLNSLVDFRNIFLFFLTALLCFTRS